jgi:outer membrane lipoprotein-sorting protein
MSNRKFVVHWTTNVTGKPVIYFAATLALACTVLAPVTAHAQSASDVYKKMSDLYSFAKSYQGTIVRTEKATTPDGKSAVQTVTVKITFKGPNKYIVKNMTSITVAGKSQQSTQIMVTDGKTLLMYSPDKKLYQRGQVPNQNMLSRFFAQMNPGNGFSFLPESKVDGRSVFVLKPNVPTTGTPEQLANAKKVKVSILIDKQTFQFVKMTIAGATGSLTQAASGQTVNVSIPDSAFVWTPPASYKEVKAPGSPGGGPSMPGKALGR